MRIRTALLLALFASLLAGCASPAWYWQALNGQRELLAAREDIATRLATARPGDPWQAELQLSREILAFAEAELDLPANGSYSSLVVLDRPAVSWMVVAAPEFSLNPRTTCFLIAGCVPYLGWFEEARARQAAERLAGKGHDVHVAAVGAYSSLGWFKDPLLSTTLELPAASLAGLLFHELAHQKLFVRGDTDFNEAYASFVEETGVGRWGKVHGETLDLTAEARQAERAAQLAAAVDEARSDLAELYASERPVAEKRAEKARLFAHLRATPGAAGLDNNAALALQRSYAGGRCAFAGLLIEADGKLREFHRLAARQAGLGQEQRKDWLETPC